MPSHLRKVDHVTCVVRQDTIRQWAWFYIDVLGGALSLRMDDTNPTGDSSMMVWTIDFEDFGIALIAGIDRKEKSHVTAFVEKHGDHSFQHVAFQVPNLDAFCERLSTFGVKFLGETLSRRDASGRYTKQVFGNPFHDGENSSLVGFYEFVERPGRVNDETGEADGAPEISFSERAGALLYQQAQSVMAEDQRGRMTRFSKMPPNWVVPEPTRPRSAEATAESLNKRRGRRELDAQPLGEIRRWQNYRTANARFPGARAAELGEMCRLTGIVPGETVAEVGSGSGALTYRLGAAVGPSGRVFTYDISRDNLVSVMLGNEDGLPIVPVAQAVTAPMEYVERFPNVGEVDCVATLATFHHFDNRSVGRGTRGREAAIAAFHRLLKPGGRLVIGDVAAGTAPQRYFDAIDNPRYCSPNGHPHDFLTGAELGELVRAAGFTDIKYAVRPVPWVFASKGDAVDFLSAMHNAQCPADEMLALIEDYLRFDEARDRCLLQWELLFLEARKA